MGVKAELQTVTSAHFTWRRANGDASSLDLVSVSTSVEGKCIFFFLKAFVLEERSHIFNFQEHLTVSYLEYIPKLNISHGAFLLKTLLKLESKMTE